MLLFTLLAVHRKSYISLLKTGCLSLEASHLFLPNTFPQLIRLRDNQERRKVEEEKESLMHSWASRSSQWEQKWGWEQRAAPAGQGPLTPREPDRTRPWAQLSQKPSGLWPSAVPVRCLNGMSNPRSAERLRGFLLLGLEDFFSHRSNSGSPNLSKKTTGMSAPCTNWEEPPDPERETPAPSAQKQGASPAQGCGRRAPVSTGSLEALPVQQKQSINKQNVQYLKEKKRNYHHLQTTHPSVSLCQTLYTFSSHSLIPHTFCRDSGPAQGLRRADATPGMQMRVWLIPESEFQATKLPQTPQRMDSKLVKLREEITMTVSKISIEIQ